MDGGRENEAGPEVLRLFPCRPDQKMRWRQCQQIKAEVNEVGPHVLTF